MLGFNLVAWDEETNLSPTPWFEAIAKIKALGIRRITMVCYRFLDVESGTITENSAHGLVAGPTVPVIAAVLEHGRAHGFDVGILPFVEVDNPSGIGHIWRGSVTFDRQRLPEFFAEYETYIHDVASIARDGGASRFYIGSELAALTKDANATPYWMRLIAALRTTLGKVASCKLSYAANHDEFKYIPFWGELDEIGVDAYFALASTRQAKGPEWPSEDVLMHGWNRVLKTLKSFSNKQQRQLTISEWGMVPFDLASTRPWHWQPSATPDDQEQSTAYQALLRSILTEGNWLSACDLWHWRMPGNEGSAYGIDCTYDAASYIQRYAAAGE